MGGPDVAWKAGRSDFADESLNPPRGRLPDGAQAADHLRHIFYRMGFNDQEIVALSGAHNLGRCHGDRSGFEGAWVVQPTRFSNQVSGEKNACRDLPCIIGRQADHALSGPLPPRSTTSC